MIEIYGKPACPFCDKAKALCETRNYPFTYKSMGNDFSREELLEMFPDARTVPQIKVNGRSIGGFDQLLRYIEETGYTGSGHTIGT
jgi:glutaredoxin